MMLHAANWTHAGDVRPEPGRYASPVDIRERIEACAAAGFGGMGFIFVDIENALTRYSPGDLRAMFADNGITFLELEVLVDWFHEPAEDIDGALRTAEAIGARQIKAVGDMTGDASIEAMARGFGRTCDRFADLDAKVVIELMQLSNLRTLERGRAVVEGAGRANGGLLFDSWHIDRCGMALDEIAALPAGIFQAIELCGVPEERAADIYAEMVDLRLQPDEGHADNARLVRAARAAGFDGPWGIEIVSAAHRALPVAEAAKRSADAVRAVLERASV